jgi:hypothetical protein
LAVAVLIVVIAGVGAPYLRADYFASRIQAGLEQSLGRKVRIGNARYNVFTGPGFQVEEVTIAEDSRIGIEPFAHVAEVHARVDVWSLFRGEIRFSNLRLVEPTVNFARTTGGQWNFELFLERTSAAQLPPIQIRQGRVNFKFGDRKSVPYLGNVDLDVVPGDASALRLVASAEPFRTDRPATTVGRFHLRTSVRNGQVDGELEGERASIAEIAKLMGARDLGLKGFVSAAFVLKGPLDAVGVSGELKLDDLSGGMLLPKSNSGALPVTGTLNLHGHEIRLQTAPPASGGALPVTVQVQAKEYFAEPEWSGEIRFEGFAAPAMLELSKRLGATVPEGFSVEKGSLSGKIAFDHATGMVGDVALAGGALKLPSGGELEDASFLFAVAGHNIDLKVHSVETEDAEKSKLFVDGRYDLDARTLAIRLQTRAGSTMPVGETVKLIPESTLLSQFRQGNWKGQIRYDSAREDSPWSGQVDISDGVVDVDGLGSPVTVSFSSTFDRGRVAVKSLKGVCGKLHFTGDYRYDAPGLPHKLNVSAETLDLAELERVLRPSLARGGFFTKTLRIGSAPVPEWLSKRKVEGTIRLAKVVAPGLPKVEKVTAQYRWNGVKGKLENLRAVAGEDSGISVDGEITVDLAGNQPRYRSTGSISTPAIQVEGSFDTEGMGAALLSKLVSKGEFRAEKVRFNPEWTFDEVTGNYTASITAGGQPRFTLSGLNLTQGSDSFQGQGSTQADGKLALELSGPRRQVKVVGSLLPPTASQQQH